MRINVVHSILSDGVLEASYFARDTRSSSNLHLNIQHVVPFIIKLLLDISNTLSIILHYAEYLSMMR